MSACPSRLSHLRFVPSPSVFPFMFLFSSRSRHTRWPRDWSSDVCSSDLDIITRNVFHHLTTKGHMTAAAIDELHPQDKITHPAGLSATWPGQTAGHTACDGRIWAKHRRFERQKLPLAG